MKILLSISLMFLCGIHAYTQNSEVFIPSDAHSPNAVDLGSYGFMPVSFYTGRANVSIPIFSTSQRGVPMSVTLDYNTSGIPANGLPGWTGIGWTLNAGGVITRSVNGLPDEYIPPHDLNVYGFYNYFQSHGRLSLDLGHTANNFEYIKNNAATQKFDYAPDVFFFNFMDKHGSFFLGEDGEWKIRCDENIDVQLDTDDQSSLIYPLFGTCPGRTDMQPKCIKGFTLVDDSGKKYVFGGENEGDLSHIEFSIPLFRTRERDLNTCWIANSWFLKRVEDRFGNILYSFNYERGKFLIQAHHEYERNRITGTYAWYFQGGYSYSSAFGLFPYYMQLVAPVYLTSITMLDKQSVTFLMDKTVELSSHDFFTRLYDYYGSDLYSILRERSGIGNYYSIKPFFYLQANDDSISIYQKANNDKMTDPLASMSLSPLKCIKLNSLGNTYKTFDFKYGFPNTPRFHINEIDIYEDTTNQQLGYSMCYKFRYKNMNLFPQDRLTTAIDHWGYYNAHNSGNGYNEHNLVGSDGIQIYSYRNVNLAASQYGMLSDIIYPTGGCTELQYEQNDFSSYQSDDRTVMRDSMGFAGGLRIKHITEYEDSTKTKMLGKRTFSYKTTSDNSSGELFSRPRYAWINWKTDLTASSSVSMDFVRTNSIIPLCNSFGPHIGYSCVRETNADGTSTLYQFNNISSCMDESFSLCFSEQPSPYDKYSEHGYKRGKLIKKDIVSMEGALVKSEEFKYETARIDTAFCWTSNIRQSTPQGGYYPVIYTGGVYKLYYPRYDVISSTTTTLFDDTYMKDSTIYSYSDLLFSCSNGYSHQASYRILTGETTFRAGEKVTRDYVYKTSIPYRNKYFFPLSSTTTKLNNAFIEKKETAYSQRNGHYVPSHEIVSTGTSGIKDTITTYNEYDGTFRLKRYTDKDGVPVRLYWDNDDRLVARIKSDSGNIGFNSDTSDPLQVLTIANQSVFTRKDTEAEVYMYNDRGLMKSKTFGNGQTEYYYYDSMNRLSEVRDTYNKVIQRYVYKYKTGIRDTQ